MSRADTFRARVAEEYDGLSPADLEAVEEVAATLDTIEDLARSLAEADGLTEVRQGGRRMRPEVVELRLQRVTLDRLLRRFPALTEEA